jgi:hypothetical protein
MKADPADVGLKAAPKDALAVSDRSAKNWNQSELVKAVKLFHGPDFGCAAGRLSVMPSAPRE